jgi:hypothetical protein
VKDAPYFIMGCRRSGTTLVSQILDSHSRLATYHESYFYPIFRPELRWYGDLGRPRNLGRLIADVREITVLQGAQPPSAEAIREALSAPTFEAVLAALLALHARGQGKERGGDKTPEHYAYLDEILEKFPDSPVVFLMRDPRDTVRSIQRTFDIPIEDGARSWNAAFLALLGARRPVHQVRYEALVAAPERHVGELCGALGEAYEERMLTFFQRVPEKWKAKRGGEKIAQPVNAGSVGAWRDMPSSDVALIESLCGEGMEAMDYRFAGARPPVVRAAAGAAARSPRAFPALVLERLRYYGTNAERWRRGLARWRLMVRVRAHRLVSVMLGERRARG